MDLDALVALLPAEINTMIQTEYLSGPGHFELNYHLQPVTMPTMLHDISVANPAAVRHYYRNNTFVLPVFFGPSAAPPTQYPPDTRVFDPAAPGIDQLALQNITKLFICEPNVEQIPVQDDIHGIAGTHRSVIPAGAVFARTENNPNARPPAFRLADINMFSRIHTIAVEATDYMSTLPLLRDQLKLLQRPVTFCVYVDRWLGLIESYANDPYARELKGYKISNPTILGRYCQVFGRDVPGDEFKIMVWRKDFHTSGNVLHAIDRIATDLLQYIGNPVTQQEWDSLGLNLRMNHLDVDDDWDEEIAA